MHRILALAGAALLSTPMHAQVRVPPGILGQPAPSLGVDSWINLPRGKKSIDLPDLRGKVVVLYCFQAWCPSGNA